MQRSRALLSIWLVVLLFTGCTTFWNHVIGVDRWTPVQQARSATAEYNFAIQCRDKYFSGGKDPRWQHSYYKQVIEEYERTYLNEDEIPMDYDPSKPVVANAAPTPVRTSESDPYDYMKLRIVKGYMDVYEAALAVIQYEADHYTYYVTEGGPSNNCQDYSWVFFHQMNVVKFKVRTVYGQGWNGIEWEYHLWNEVTDEQGRTLYVDATWFDAQGSSINNSTLTYNQAAFHKTHRFIRYVTSEEALKLWGKG